MIQKYKYRFKTQEEFLIEFGDNWRSDVECSFVGQMDTLLGKEIDEIYYNTLDVIFNQDCGGNFHYLNNWIGCNVSKDMVKRIDLSPNYKPKKFVY